METAWSYCWFISLRLVSFLIDLSILIETSNWDKERMNMFGLGKTRSRFGKYLDEHGVKQESVLKESGLNRETVTKACREDNPKMRGITKQALVDAVKKLTGKPVSKKDFWS
jgi:hypothetical protein